MKKVGTITAALGLVVLGLALLSSRLFPHITWLDDPLKWWPLLLVGLGIELILFRFFGQETAPKLDFLVILLLLAILGAKCFELSKSEIMNAGVFGHRFSVSRQYEAFIPAKGLQNIDISLSEGNIRILPATDGVLRAKTHVTVSSGAKMVLPTVWLRVEKQGSRAVIETIGDILPTRYQSRQTETVIYVPKKLPVMIHPLQGSLTASSLDNPLTVEQAEGSMTLSDLAAPIKISGGSGSVHLTRVNSVFAELSNGEARIVDSQGVLRLSLQSGQADIQDFRGPVSVSVDAGEIRLNSTKPITSDTAIQTHEGSISVLSDTLKNCRFKAIAASGSLTLPAYLGAAPSAGENAENIVFEKTLGTGVPSITLQAEHGNISVR